MRYFIILALQLVGVCAQAQVVTVMDARSGEPIELVRISGPKVSGFEVYTSAQGEASISGLQSFSVLYFSRVGYQTRTLSRDELQALNFEVSMQKSTISMDQLVISGSKWEQAAREIPIKVIAIDQLEREQLQPQTAADLLGISGEVFIQKSQQGGGSPMIRGFSTNRLLYVVDGVRMNTAIFRSGNLHNVIALDPFAIDRTEVLFGPGSILYGSDAIGAVMSFETLKPSHSLDKKLNISGSAKGRYASANNEQTAHLHLNIGGEKWAFLSSVTHYDFGNLVMGRFGPAEYLQSNYVEPRPAALDYIEPNPNEREQNPTAYSQTNFMQKIRYRPNRYWDAEYGFHYSESSNIPRYDRLIQTRNGLPRNSEWFYGPQKWLMHNISATHVKSSSFYDRAVFRVAYQQFEESRIDRGFQSAERRRRSEMVDAYSANLDLIRILDEKTTFFYGLEAVHNEVDSRATERNLILRISPYPASSRYPDASWTSLAAYASLQYQINPSLLLQSGLRYSRFILDADFSDNLPFFPLPFSKLNLNEGAFSGSMGLSWNPQPDWSVNVNLSTGFRAPNVDDAGKIFDSEPGRVIVPNANLGPEYAYNAEFGVTHVIGEWAKIDVSTYYTHLDDALVRRAFSLDGRDSVMYDGELSQVQAIQNAAHARVYGFQFGVEVQVGELWSLSSRLNVQEGKEEAEDGSSNPSRHAAPWFGVSRIRFQSDRWDLTLSSIYSGKLSFEDLAPEEQGKPHIYARDANGNPYSPSWMLVNLNTQYRISEHVDFNVGIENLSNRRYRPYSSGIAASGTNLIASISIDF